MILNALKPRLALNKAFLKVKPNRSAIESFKANLITLLDRTNDKESEEFHKNLVSDFLKKTYYDPNHFINTKGRNDLVIHNGHNAHATVGVILEAKKPTNKAEMMQTHKLNSKAFQELVLYYLRERITHKNLEVKHLVATNINEWFIFDATLFERLFAQNKSLVKQFTDFEEGRLADTKTDFFYKQIAEPFIDSITADIEFTYFNIQDYQLPLRNADKADDSKLIALFKLLSPEHLLKLPFTNDSNSLDKRFYAELLHIIGLSETKEGSKKLIERNKPGSRNSGTLLEDAIIQLDSMDKLSRLENAKQYGNTLEERQFNVALELCITWINRILFLKLLEGQLIAYHKGDKSYSFLNSSFLKEYDDLNSLFFQVLAKKQDQRNEDVLEKFAKVPYLNSSLFEPTELEHNTLFISNLKDAKTIPLHPQTVLRDQSGKKRTGEITALEYLFEFLNAYDFSSEGSEDIQEDNKTLINASVLGLIFEKINGYKDGSFFTPGFITMYMCRETIRKAVVQKFNETKNWNCNTLEELYDKIEDRKEANDIVNRIKICDPAVGSGHFLVSALNEMIAVKNDLKILQDREGKRLKEYHVEVVNDELIVTDEEGELFEYNPANKESQRIQETLFHEKQTIIENCLFGVDINSNSVKICRLRLWIELLKNAYYLKSSSPAQGEVSAGRRGQALNNLPYLKTFRKNLRNNLTPAEAKLWTMLKGKQMEGRKFRRQHSVANYILDFYCPEESIAIELDGQGHFEATQAEYDRERDLFLEMVGIRVLRFENKWVWDNPDGLLEVVKGYFGKQPPRPADTPPLKGGELLELQTLPNIDINIKCGNSLVSRFAIDADLRQALKKSKWSIESYRIAVDTYRNAESKEQKREMERLIADIKSDFRSEIGQKDPKVLKLIKLEYELSVKGSQLPLGMSSKEKAAWNTAIEKLTNEIQKLKTEIEEIKANKIFENAFEWRFEFPEVLNDDGDFVGFDVVIGNPPYIRQEEIKELKPHFKSQFKLYTGTADVYIFFIEKGFDILKNKGVFTFIMPNKFMQAGYGQPARKFLLEHNLIEIVDFGDFQVFEEATTYPCILTAGKEAAKETFKTAKINSPDFINDFPVFVSSITNVINHNSLNDETWVVSNSQDQNLLQKVVSIGKKLEDYINQGAKRGVVTGFSEAFVIDENKRIELIKEDRKNENIIKPLLQGRDIKPYHSTKPDKYLLFIPWHFPMHEEKDISGASSEAETAFQKQYSSVYQHLLKFKAELSSRNKVETGIRYEWYAMQRYASDYYQEFEKPKIMYQVLQVKPCFIYDEDGLFCNNSIWFMPSDDKVLLGILNSKMGWWLISKYCTAIQNGYQLIWKYFSQIPIAMGNDIVRNKISNLVNKILSTKRQKPSANTTDLEHQIDQLVYQLYGLTEEEIKIVEGL